MAKGASLKERSPDPKYHGIEDASSSIIASGMKGLVDNYTNSAIIILFLSKLSDSQSENHRENHLKG
ncbi:MAG: hypothetical protein ACUVUQ_09550, partial [Thermodesulfovibrionales bacterium]